MYHPEVPSCEDCRTWMYDEKTWKQVLRLQAGPDGTPAKLPVKRAKGLPLPCVKCPKSGPECGVPRPDRELTVRNQFCLMHYMRCKASGHFPDDPIVTQHAGIIRQIEDAYQRQSNMMPMLLAAMFGKK